jgi:hypothetical protein
MNARTLNPLGASISIASLAKLKLEADGGWSDCYASLKPQCQKEHGTAQVPTRAGAAGCQTAIQLASLGIYIHIEYDLIELYKPATYTSDELRVQAGPNEIPGNSGQEPWRTQELWCKVPSSSGSHAHRERSRTDSDPSGTG